MEEHNFIENSLIILTKATIDTFLKADNPAELIALYTFYYYTAKWQKTNQIKATTGYAATGLKWSEAKIRKIKKQLLDYGVIEDVKAINDKGQIKGHYIKMNYIFKQSTVDKIHTVENPQGGKTHRVDDEGTNALSDNILNASNTNNINALSANTQTKAASGEVLTETETMFNEFWKAYPKKVNKKGAYTSFKKIKNLKETLPIILDALEVFKKSKSWTKDNGQFIPHPQTWINQERWNDQQDETRETQLQKIDMSDWL